MTPVHRLGEMTEPAARYRELVVQIPEQLAQALDEHLTVHLESPTNAVHRDAVIALSLRDHLDTWPERHEACAGNCAALHSQDKPDA